MQPESVVENLDVLKYPQVLSYLAYLLATLAGQFYGVTFKLFVILSSDLSYGMNAAPFLNLIIESYLRVLQTGGGAKI